MSTPTAKQRQPTFTGRARPVYTHGKYDVLQAAQDRIAWLFDEFDNQVSVDSSGGKDSTIVVELAAAEARKRGVKLPVSWQDQEHEFQATVDYQRHLAYERDDIEFYWFQWPFLLWNTTNYDEPWAHVWDPEHPENWMRDKEPIAITEHNSSIYRFSGCLEIINNRYLPGAVLDGVRMDESPSRALSLTTRPAYKYATWSGYIYDYPDRVTKHSPGKYRFHPVYDWAISDVWKAIHDHGWRYNDHYDQLFRYGTQTQDMRVSNYHHETAGKSLYLLQETEPETWDRATRAREGFAAYASLQDDQFISQLPYMFGSWEEYVHHLIDNLHQDEDTRDTYRAMYRKLQKRAPSHQTSENLGQVMSRAVINNDRYGTTVDNFLVQMSKFYREET